MRNAIALIAGLVLAAGIADPQTPRPAPVSAPPAAGGTCAGLGGDVTGTCAANTIKDSVALTGTPTTPTGTSGDGTTQIANDSFVATALASINPAVSVQAATIAVLSNTPTYSNGTAGVGATLTAGSNGALSVDGYTVLLNDRILVKNQASSLQNGVYTETTLGTGSVPYVLTRATDYNSVSNINYTGTIPVIQGSTLLNTGWNLTTQVATIGTNALSYTQAAAGSSGGPPGGNVKATGNLANFAFIEGAGGKTIQSVTSPNCTDTVGQHLNYASATGAITCGTSVPANNTLTIASGTSAMATSAISSGTCATVVTTSATGTATTDNIQADFNADPTSTTGYSPTVNGMLTVIKYPTLNNVNFKVCNNTSASVTPGAVTFNWRVVR